MQNPRTNGWAPYDHGLRRLSKYSHENELSSVADRLGQLSKVIVPTPHGWAVRVGVSDVIWNSDTFRVSETDSTQIEKVSLNYTAPPSP